MDVLEYIDGASRFGRDAQGGVTRLAWTPAHMEVSAWFRDRLSDSGLLPSTDAAGNVIGKWETGGGAPLLLGSHLDTVPNGGRFDGALGVLGSLAAIDLLKNRGVRPMSPIWIVSFMDEEGVRFGASMVGSRAFVGQDLAALGERLDSEGTSLADAMSGWGLDPAKMSKAQEIGRVGSYLELHVEQGPILDEAGVDVGIVTGIVGLLQAHVRLRGEANHAGTTPMRSRLDPLMAASRVILSLRDEARSRSGMTVTVGSIRTEPGAFNVIPETCTFGLDVRTSSEECFRGLRGWVEATVQAISESEGVESTVRISDEDPPTELDPVLAARLEEAAEIEGVSSMRLPSGAGHDAMVLAPHVPAAMLFVPSEKGISHSPREATRPEHCRAGVAVLARAVELLTA